MGCEEAAKIKVLEVAGLALVGATASLQQIISRPCHLELLINDEPTPFRSPPQQLMIFRHLGAQARRSFLMKTLHCQRPGCCDEHEREVCLAHVLYGELTLVCCNILVCL